jgi:competence protein ComFC
VYGKERYLCAACEKENKIGDAPCHQCGRDLEMCSCPADGFFPFDEIVCVYYYKGGAKDAMHRFKFQNKKYYAGTFAKLLAERIGKFLDAAAIDAVLPVPMSKESERARGYNQSALLAGKVAEEIGKPHLKGVLLKPAPTRVQSGLSLKERKENVKGAFQVADQKAVRGKRLLLIDDIITTGATLSECARVLKESGADRVFAAALCATEFGRKKNEGREEKTRYEGNCGANKS